jgi:chemotaxis methyl-accepting protein methylase
MTLDYRETPRMTVDVYFFTNKLAKVGRTVWQHIPSGLQEWPPVRALGASIHVVVRRFSRRSQSHMTWFLRYPLMLQTIGEWVNDQKLGEPLRLCVAGCSTGAEMYSFLWAIRKARCDLKIQATGIDLAVAVIEKARAGRYQRNDPEMKGVSEESLSELFDLTQSGLRIKEPIAAGVEWIVADIRDARLRAQLGPQDIVVATNFLIHMREAEAAACLRDIVQLVRPGGLLVCRGIDLDVREHVARQFGLQPVSNRIEEIHNAELNDLRNWPWRYWATEALDKTRKDWARRYATIFQMPCPPVTP